MIKKQTLISALKLCSYNKNAGTVCYSNSLQNLSVDLYPTIVRNRMKDNLSEEDKKIESQYRMINYMSQRLTDITVRLHMIEWIWNEFKESSEEEYISFYYIGALLIKDFHIDVGSFMDSLAPIIIQTNQKLKSKERRKLPRYSDIQSDSNRSFRNNLLPELLQLVDESERWWAIVKKIRDIVTHRKHDKLVFGPPGESKLFQVYDDSFAPSEIDPVFTLNNEGKVVEFEKYAAFILAEIMVLLDNLGHIVAKNLNKSINRKHFTILRLPYIYNELSSMLN